jgi:hypothetical protein
MTLRLSLKVSIDYELLASEVAYIELASGVSYIELASSLRLDTTGLFRFIPQTVVTTDGTAISVSKPLADILQAPTDRVSVSALKVLADGFAMNDGSEAIDGSVYSLAKGIQNVTFVADATTQSASKALADNFGQLDALAKSLSRPLADVFDLSDDQTVAALKGLSDSVSMQDSVVTLLLFIRNFDDQVGVSDLRTTVFTPSTKVEQITVTDDDFFSYQKNIADGFAMNDGSEAVDGSQYSIHKGISNVAFVGDFRSSLFTTSRLESTTVADAGFVSAQSYCDPTYFAEDYVGVSQSF